MSGTDRDLVLALRAELAAIDPSRPCDRRAEAVALADLDVARDGPMARLLLRLAPERAAVIAGLISSSSSRAGMRSPSPRDSPTPGCPPRGASAAGEAS